MKQKQQQGKLSREQIWKIVPHKNPFLGPVHCTRYSGDFFLQKSSPLADSEPHIGDWSSLPTISLHLLSHKTRADGWALKCMYFCIYLYLYLYMMINFHIAPPHKNEGYMGGSPGVSRKKIAATIHCNIAIQVGNDLRKHNQIGHCDNLYFWLNQPQAKVLELW